MKNRESLRELVCKLIKDRFGAEPEFLWEKYPDYAVFRHKENGKWFGIIMGVPKVKLGLKGDEKIDILNVKASPVDVSLLVNESCFLPAYHMNKNYWITILLDGSCPLERIDELLEGSYQLTK